MLVVDLSWYGTQQEAFLIQGRQQRYMYAISFLFFFLLNSTPFKTSKVLKLFMKVCSLIPQVLGSKFHNRLLEVIDSRLVFSLSFFGSTWLEVVSFGLLIFHLYLCTSCFEQPIARFSWRNLCMPGRRWVS